MRKQQVANLDVRMPRELVERVRVLAALRHVRPGTIIAELISKHLPDPRKERKRNCIL